MNEKRLNTAYFVVGFLLAAVIFLSGFILLKPAQPVAANTIVTANEQVAGQTITHTVTLDNPNIVLIYEDELTRIYEDTEFGARIVVNKVGGVAVYCPCEEEVCEVPPIPETQETTPVVTETPAPTTTPVPTGTPVPTETPEPTVTPTTPPSPTPTVEPTEKPHCNQGVGNGPEGCSPGNSDHNQPPNDEGQPECGYPGNPCRGGNNNQNNNQGNQNQQQTQDNGQQGQNNNCPGNSCHQNNNQDGNTPPGQANDKGKKDK
jgi:hypothetical protein